ncbi:MAG: hypothetical protein M3256_10850 [Actinomycetota bacterium]|nr:hypothetical protein [Actinomycetota bacterium]
MALVASGGGSAGVRSRDGAELASLLDREGPVSPTEVARRLGLTKAVPGLLEALSDTQAVLFPGYDEVLAFRVLVGLQTGICAEGVGGLTVDCLEWTSETRARISWFKGRGGGRQNQTFTSRGRWSPGRLIERWLAVSERARRFAERPDTLWLFCHRARPGVHRPTFCSDGLDRFVARHGLLADDSAPLRLRFSVLRPTYFARHDRDWNGPLRIDANHSAAVEGDHYLAPTRASTAIDAIIGAAQRDAVRKAATAPLTLLSTEQLDRLAASPDAAASRLAMSRDPHASWSTASGTCSPRRARTSTQAAQVAGTKELPGHRVEHELVVKTARVDDAAPRADHHRQERRPDADVGIAEGGGQAAGDLGQILDRGHQLVVGGSRSAPGDGHRRGPAPELDVEHPNAAFEVAGHDLDDAGAPAGLEDLPGAAPLDGEHHAEGLGPGPRPAVEVLSHPGRGLVQPLGRYGGDRPHRRGRRR